MIVIDESHDLPRGDLSDPPPASKVTTEKPKVIVYGEKGRWTHCDKQMPSPKQEYLNQKIDLGDPRSDDDDDWLNDNADEKSASLTNLNEVPKPNPHTEHLKRLLQRTESTEAIAAQRNLQLRRQYLLGGTANVPRKSVSTADLGNKFKSFMDKISETQKMLNPAPQPSPAMQVFMNKTPATQSPILSPSAPHLLTNKVVPDRSISLPEGDKDEPKLSNHLESSSNSTDTQISSKETKNLSDLKDECSSENSKSEELGKLYSFPVPGVDGLSGIRKDNDNKEKPGSSKVISSSFEEYPSSKESDYDNVPSDVGRPIVRRLSRDKSGDLMLSDKKDDKRTSLTAIEKNSDLNNISSDDDEFGEKKQSSELKSMLDLKTDTVQTVNLELVSINSCKTLKLDEKHHGEVNPSEATLSHQNPVEKILTSSNRNLEEKNSKFNDSSILASDIDDQFEQLASEAINESYKHEFQNEKTSKNSTQNESGRVNGTVTGGKMESSDNKSLLVSDLDTSKINSEIIKSDTKKETLSSPESKLTEADLSDWAIDNDVNICDENNDKNKCVANTTKHIARIASIESLGDTDSAISTGPSKTASVPSKLSVLNDLDSIEFVDTSESASSPEDVIQEKYGYKKLEEETPTTPLAPEIPMIIDSKVQINSLENNLSEETESESPGTETESSCSNASEMHKVVSVQNNIEKSDEIKNVNKEKSVSPKFAEPSKSLSEPSSFADSKNESEKRRESLESYSSPKRYEGYISRFKDRPTPFSYARDSLDIHKSSSRKALFTPSKEDILQREKNESALELSLLNNSQSVNEDKIISKNQTNINQIKKDKDGDVVAAMVMARITRQSPDKGARRCSRTSASPLSNSGSRSSLFTRSSKENLLDKNGISNSSLNNSMSENNLQNNKLLNECEDPESKSVIKNNLINYQLSKESDSDIRKLSCSKNSVNDILLSDDAIIQKLSNNKDKDLVDSPSKQTNLPATPLTHPEKFKDIKTDGSVSNIYKISQSSSSSAISIRPRAYSESVTTPKNRMPSSNNQTTVEREKLREEARQKAKLKTDRDLGLSPPNLADNLRNKLKMNSFSDNEFDKDEKERTNNQITSQPTVPLRVKPKSNALLMQTPTSSRNSDSSLRNKDERMRELLAEHRQRDSESQMDISRSEKEDRVRERLEEYRQKRASVCGSGSVIQNGKSDTTNATSNKSGIVRRHTHRPSLLELESMQVFLSSNANNAANNSSSVAATTNLPNEITTQTAAGITKSTSTSQIPTDSVGIKSAEPNSEKKPAKKGKDRERRRSLIQVFAGMFGKSDEKKKSGRDNPDPDGSVPDASFSSTNSADPSPHCDASKPSPPKSPHSVKDKFARLRISRSKQKVSKVRIKGFVLDFFN